MKHCLILAIFLAYTIVKIDGRDAKKKGNQMLHNNHDWEDHKSRYETFWGQTYQKPVFVINPFVLRRMQEMKHKNRKTGNRRAFTDVLPGVNSIEKGLVHAGQSIVHIMKGVRETALGIGGATYGGIVGALAGVGSGALLGAQKGMLFAVGNDSIKSSGMTIHLEDHESDDKPDNDEDL